MADSEPANNNKRRLRAPETSVRQKAEQAQAKANKPEKPRRLRTAAAKTTHKPRRVLRKVFYRQPFIFLGRIVFPRFLRGAFQELRLVNWPNRRETRQLTTAVLLFAIVFGVAIGLVDYGLNVLFKQILIK